MGGNMNKTKINKIVISSAYGLLLLLIAFNFYLNGYLRDYSIYDYNFLYALNLLIIPSLALLYFYLKKESGKLKLPLYFLLAALFFINIFIFSQANKSINDYQEGALSFFEITHINNNFRG